MGQGHREDVPGLLHHRRRRPGEGQCPVRHPVPSSPSS
jgi:hypothetical protein